MTAKARRRLWNDLRDPRNYREVAIYTLAAASFVGFVVTYVSSLGLMFLVSRLWNQPSINDLLTLCLIAGFFLAPVAGWVALALRRYVSALLCSAYPLAWLCALIFNASA